MIVFGWCFFYIYIYFSVFLFSEKRTARFSPLIRRWDRFKTISRFVVDAENGVMIPAQSNEMLMLGLVSHFGIFIFINTQWFSLDSFDVIYKLSDIW